MVYGHQADATPNAMQNLVVVVGLGLVTDQNHASPVKQLKDTSSNHSISSHAASFCEKPAEFEQAGMLVANRGGDSWNRPVNNLLLGSVLSLVLLALLCIVWLARGTQ